MMCKLPDNNFMSYKGEKEKHLLESTLCRKLDISSSVSRKENETLHFNMVKGSVASTRTP